MELHQRMLLRAARPLAGLLGLLLATASGAQAAAPAAPLTDLTRLAAQGARVSAAVWDLDADLQVAQLGATTRLVPASLSKIVIAAAALETWPPDHAFPTELRAAAPATGGVLAGDLVLRGGGDATLDETTLWALAAQLRASGVTRVRGRMLVERAPFGDLACDTVDRCSSLRRSARAYNATPSAIGVNYGSWCVRARAHPGATRAEVGGCASGLLPIPLSGSVAVAASGPALRVERLTDEAGERIAVSGSVAPGGERSVHRAMSDPVAGTGLLMRGILQQSGIVVDGGVETTLRAAPEPARLLARVEGLPVQEQIGRMMRYSNNYIADVLTMGVALAREPVPPASLADASRQLAAFLVRAGVATAQGVPVMESGSGLTTGNRLSADDLIRVLRHQYRDARRFPAFYGTLTVPRDAPFAYLRGGGADWQDRVALKTGSLSEPVSVQGLAGYLRKKGGGWMAFAVIVNGSEGRAVSQDQAMRAARGDLERILAAW